MASLSDLQHFRKKYPWRIYVGFVADIDIKIFGGGGGWVLLHSLRLWALLE
jgi:hypothetical protein